MRKLILTISFVLFGVAYAQQFVIPAQLDRNLLYINPAYAGSLEATVASLMYRNQWVQMSGAPVFQNFEVHAPLKKQNMALGLQVKNESMGGKNNTELFFTYAYRILMENATLSFALKAGGQNINFSESVLSDERPDDAFLNNSTFLPNVGFGVGYYSSKYFVGFSIPYFFGVIGTTDGGNSLDFDMNRLTYNISGGGNVTLNDQFTIKPMGLFSYSMALKPQLVAVVNVEWMKSFILGTGYKLSKEIIFNAGYALNQQLSFAYTYEYNLEKLGTYSKNTHEIGLQYYFGYKVNTINPREF